MGMGPGWLWVGDRGVVDPRLSRLIAVTQGLSRAQERFSFSLLPKPRCHGGDVNCLLHAARKERRRGPKHAKKRLQEQCDNIAANHDDLR